MFTDCPSCERLFRIRAAQLSAAEGWVRCGHCAEMFYALERLYDAPVRKPPAQPQTGDAAQEAPAAGAGAAQTDAPPAGTPETGFVPAGQEEEAESETAAATEARAAPAKLPPVLENGPGEAARTSSRHTWVALAVILLLVALAQGAWFNRDWLLRAYPQLTPWAEKLCERLQCDIIRYRDVSAIKLLNQEVRLHPRYQDAFLASATIVNHAGFIQRYPDIELLVYDKNGQVISHGRYSPAEYLNADISPGAGMPVGAPVHFALELAGAAYQAASF